MSDYPQLKDMGIQRPEQIRSYMVNSISGIDVLRIVYKRDEGSLLPISRNYEFPRVQRTVKSSKGEEQAVLETAPALRAAVTELKTLMAARKDKPELAAALLQELAELEQEMHCRIEHLRELIENA